jgi:hypothetical protein
MLTSHFFHPRSIFEVVDSYREMTEEMSQKHFAGAHLASTANRLLQQYFHLLSGIFADPGCFLDPGSWMFPGSRILDPGSRIKEIPDPGSRSASKNLSIFNPKNCF